MGNNNIPKNPAPVETGKQEEAVFEAQAYGSPQPDAGSDVTVLKTVGIGGPVPIVAPKHNTIQLQPIVVPLAVVPYMTQDSSVLRTDGRPAGGTLPQDYGEDVGFHVEDSAESERVRKPKTHARIFSLVSLILTLVLTLPFIIAYFDVKIGGLSLAEFNTIGLIESWIDGAKFSLSPVSNLLNIAAMAILMVLDIVLLIALIAGKYPRAFTVIFTFIAFACLLADLLIDVIKKSFVLSDRIILLVMLALLGVALILSIIFVIIVNRLEDKAEEKESEI